MSIRAGEVIEFDQEVGLGLIRAENGAEFPFQCLSIADGTRQIPEGAHVNFQTTRRFGRDEATAIVR